MHSKIAEHTAAHVVLDRVGPHGASVEAAAGSLKTAAGAPAVEPCAEDGRLHPRRNPSAKAGAHPKRPGGPQPRE